MKTIVSGSVMRCPPRPGAYAYHPEEEEDRRLLHQSDRHQAEVLPALRIKPVRGVSLPAGDQAASVRVFLDPGDVRTCRDRFVPLVPSTPDLLDVEAREAHDVVLIHRAVRRRVVGRGADAAT